jgi:hypothetical protein
VEREIHDCRSVIVGANGKGTDVSKKILETTPGKHSLDSPKKKRLYLEHHT